MPVNVLTFSQHLSFFTYIYYVAQWVSKKNITYNSKERAWRMQSSSNLDCNCLYNTSFTYISQVFTAGQLQREQGAIDGYYFTHIPHNRRPGSANVTLRALMVEPTALKIWFSLVLPIFQLIHLSHLFISQGKSL